MSVCFITMYLSTTNGYVQYISIQLRGSLWSFEIFYALLSILLIRTGWHISNALHSYSAGTRFECRRAYRQLYFIFSWFIEAFPWPVNLSGNAGMEAETSPYSYLRSVSYRQFNRFWHIMQVFIIVDTIDPGITKDPSATLPACLIPVLWPYSTLNPVCIWYSSVK
jgi:hypothetical protein